jgi:hypothetical protein
MKILVLLSIFLYFESAKAESITQKIKNFLGFEDPPQVSLSPSNIELPPIPEIKKNATSTRSLKKDAKILTQGEQYNKLKKEKKRKYEIAFLKELYKVTRQSKASNEDILKWLNIIEQGGSREGVYRALVLDNVYASLENYDEPLNKEVVNFCEAYMQKFIRQTFNKEVYQQINVYTLKRILSEKSLEVLDALANKPEHVYSWYAVFSSALAKKYPDFFKSKLRKNTLKETHLSWAKKVPYQHIKSEVVVKIHHVLNQLAK